MCRNEVTSKRPFKFRQNIQFRNVSDHSEWRWRWHSWKFKSHQALLHLPKRPAVFVKWQKNNIANFYVLTLRNSTEKLYSALHKICQNTSFICRFLYRDRMFNAAFIRGNTVQRKRVLWQIFFETNFRLHRYYGFFMNSNGQQMKRARKNIMNMFKSIVSYIKVQTNLQIVGFLCKTLNP